MGRAVRQFQSAGVKKGLCHFFPTPSLSAMFRLALSSASSESSFSSTPSPYLRLSARSRSQSQTSGFLGSSGPWR